MTTMQISLRNVKNEEAKLVEEKRHNLVTEGYTQEHYERQDAASALQAQASWSQAETARSQLAINAINAETNRFVAETGRLNYYETSQHNRAMEALGWGELAEKTRHDTELEGISWAEVNEKHRTNIEHERIDYLNAETNTINAETKRKEYNLANRKYWTDLADTAVQRKIDWDKNRIQEEYNQGRLDIERAKLNSQLQRNNDRPLSGRGYGTYNYTNNESDDNGFFENVGESLDTAVEWTADTIEKFIDFITFRR